MPNEDGTVQQATQDQGLGFSDFLDKVHERVVARAKAENIFGIARVGNVWRLNNAEATIGHGSGALVTFRYGADASRASEIKAGSVESTADAIVDKFEHLTRSLV